MLVSKMLEIMSACIGVEPNTEFKIGPGKFIIDIADGHDYEYYGDGDPVLNDSFLAAYEVLIETDGR